MKQKYGVVYKVVHGFKFLFYTQVPVGVRVVAHCLDTDDAFIGDNLTDALQKLKKALETRIWVADRCGDFSKLWTPASGEYLAMIRGAAKFGTTRHSAMYPGFRKQESAAQQELSEIAVMLEAALYGVQR